MMQRAAALILAAVMCFGTGACLAQAEEEPPLRILRSFVRADDRPPFTGATHEIRLTIAVMSATGWRDEDLLGATQWAAEILAQCGIRTAAIEFNEFEGPARFRSVFTPVSRELARRLALPKPTLFFVADTLNRPAFDAEAVGRGNSRTRPEMTDTIWIAYGTRDLPMVIAHELAHVLADSGEHSSEPRNLMRDETSPGDTQLTTQQCRAIKSTAALNGLLQPLTGR